MGAGRAIVVPPGEGHRVGNVEFLATSEDTPRFNLAVITMEPRREGPEVHAHTAEDDSFYVLEGELTFTVDGREIVAGAGTFVLVPPEVPHTFANRGDAVARVVNVHAPAGSTCASEPTDNSPQGAKRPPGAALDSEG